MYLQKFLKATKRKSRDIKGGSSNRMQGKNMKYLYIFIVRLYLY